MDIDTDMYDDELTQPRKPIRAAWSSTNQRNPTPCTRPEIYQRLAAPAPIPLTRVHDQVGAGYRDQAGDGIPARPALVPGRAAPRLIPARAVAGMRPGSVIVDLAAEAGGNCELTQPGEIVEREDVTLVGLTNLASTMPYHASQLYARNVSALLQHLAPEGELTLDWEDEITAGACVTREQVAA